MPQQLSIEHLGPTASSEALHAICSLYYFPGSGPSVQASVSSRVAVRGACPDSCLGVGELQEHVRHLDASFGRPFRRQSFVQAIKVGLSKHRRLNERCNWA